MRQLHEGKVYCYKDVIFKVINANGEKGCKCCPFIDSDTCKDFKCHPKGTGPFIFEPFDVEWEVNYLTECVDEDFDEYERLKAKLKEIKEDMEALKDSVENYNAEIDALENLADEMEYLDE